MKYESAVNTPFTSVAITGASPYSVGWGLARRFSTSGTLVHCITRTPPGTAPITPPMGVAVRRITGDITCESDRMNFIRGIAVESLDAVVLNASTFSQGYFQDIPVSELRRVLEVNVVGNLAVLHDLLDGERLKENARVLFMLSNNLAIAPPQHLPYNCAKAALEMAMRTLAAELATRGIAVGGLHLGATNTDAFRRSAELDPTMRGLPTLSVEDVATHIEYILHLMAFPSVRPWVFHFDKE